MYEITPPKAMNNNQSAKAKILRKKGFEIFYAGGGHYGSGWYAFHPKMIYQYCIDTNFDLALSDLDKLIKNSINNTNQLEIF